MAANVVGWLAGACIRRSCCALLDKTSFRAPELTRIALIANAPNPTETCVERSFSHQGLISNDLSCSLLKNPLEP